MHWLTCINAECCILGLKKSRTEARQSALRPSLSYCLFIFTTALYCIHQRLLSRYAANSSQLFTPIKDSCHLGLDLYFHFDLATSGLPLKYIICTMFFTHRYLSLPQDKKKKKNQSARSIPKEHKCTRTSRNPLTRLKRGRIYTAVITSKPFICI